VIVGLARQTLDLKRRTFDFVEQIFGRADGTRGISRQLARFTAATSDSARDFFARADVLFARAHVQTLPDYARILPECARILPDHARILADNERILSDSARKLAESARIGPDNEPVFPDARGAPARRYESPARMGKLLARDCGCKKRSGAGPASKRRAACQ
jgi:hypothetical protein